MPAQGGQLITQTVNQFNILCQPLLNTMWSRSADLYDLTIKKQPITTAAFAAAAITTGVAAGFYWKLCNKNQEIAQLMINLKNSGDALTKANGLTQDKDTLTKIIIEASNEKPVILSSIVGDNKGDMIIYGNLYKNTDLYKNTTVEQRESINLLIANLRAEKLKKEDANKLYIVNQVVPYTIEAVLKERKEVIETDELPIDNKNEFYNGLEVKEKKAFDRYIVRGQDEVNGRVKKAEENVKHLFYNMLPHVFLLIGPNAEARYKMIQKINKKEDIFEDISDDIVQEIVKETEIIHKDNVTLCNKAVGEAVDEKAEKYCKEIKDLKKQNDALESTNKEQVEMIKNQREGLLDLVTTLNKVRNEANPRAKNYTHINLLWTKGIAIVQKFIPNYKPENKQAVKDVDDKGKERVGEGMKKSISLDDFEFTYHGVPSDRDAVTRWL